MTSVLVTAFEPYDRWTANASWLCLLEWIREAASEPAVTTRLYPVDFAAVRERLSHDLGAGYDFALHLGQAPGSGRIRLEAVALNMGGAADESPEQFRPLADDGPVAYRSTLPLADWAVKLRAAGVPAVVSYHAGTYLCNATLFWTHYLAEKRNLNTRSTFLHLPLDVSQVVAERHDQPSLPSATAAALRLLLAELPALPRLV